MKCCNSYFNFLFLGALVFNAPTAYSALVVSVTRNLDFGVVAPNDGAYVMPAASGAILSITGGSANQLVTFTAPLSSATFTMVNGVQNIVASTLTASPVALGGCFNLDAAGAGTYTLGATRPAVGAVVNAGNYSTTFTASLQKAKAGCSGTAGPTASATVTAVVKGVISIALSETTQLNFGKVAAGDTARVIAAASAPTCSSCVRGAFAVVGAVSQSYIVKAMPAAATLSSGANTMTVNGWTAACSGASGSLASDLSGCVMTAAGTDTVYLGGTLNIGAAQAAGSYSGTYTFTVAYQ